MKDGKFEKIYSNYAYKIVDGKVLAYPGLRKMSEKNTNTNQYAGSQTGTGTTTNSRGRNRQAQPQISWEPMGRDKNRIRVLSITLSLKQPVSARYIPYQDSFPGKLASEEEKQQWYGVDNA